MNGGGQLELFHGGEEGLGAHLDSLREKRSGTRTQNAGQGIIDFVRLTKPGNIAILFHGVSLSLRGSGRLDTRLDTPPMRVDKSKYHPSENELVMNELQREYFRLKLLSWREEILKQVIPVARLAAAQAALKGAAERDK